MSCPGSARWVFLRFGAAVGLALLPLLWAPVGSASAAPVCPARLGSFVHSRGIGLSHGTQDPEPRHGSGILCHYTHEYDGGFEPVESAWYDLVVEWRPDDTGTETYYCAGGTFARHATTRSPSGGRYTEDVPTTQRRVVGSLELHDPDGEGGSLPIAEARQVLRSMMRSASALAAPCPRTDGRPGTATGATGEATPTAVPGASDRDRARTGKALLGAGAVVSVAAGAGALATGRRRPAAPGANAAAQPVRRLYSGPEAVEMLQRAGLIVEVRDGDGPGRYRVQGALRQFFPQAPTHYPALSTPLRTPGGGRATHLVGLACHEPGGGIITDLQVVVLENAPPGPGPVVPGPVVPGPVVPGPAGAPGAGSGAGPAGGAAGATRPPTDPARLREWLTSAGDKRVTPEDLHALGPNLIKPDGTIAGGPYSGSTPAVRFDGNTLTLTVPAPPDAPFLPELRGSGNLTVRDGRLVAHLQGHARAVAGTVQEQLDQLTQGWHDAGMRIDDVRVEDGGLRFSVSAPHP